ncbi:TPA: phage tail protein [Aeromonas veronii]
MSQVITNAFEQYWQSCLAAEKPVVLDEFILADIPNLDITSPIDPETGLPPESQIVHRQNVDQRGRINNNAVAYTIVMDTTIGDFSFNAMYLRNKANGVIGMIVYKGRETKLKTDQTTGQTGNSLVKSMLMGYDQAAEATLTHVDAGTWQIDYAARLRGMDEDLRQLASQLYGHHTFIGDGFKVVEKDGAYQVTKGVAIVGGLRVELKAPEVIHPGTKPIGVWVDVHRAGSLLSEHQNHFTIITSVDDLTDHVDSNGYQHYVAKLATVQADSTIEDGRGSAGGGSGGAGAIPDTFALWKRSMAEAGYELIGQFGAALTIEMEEQVVLSNEGNKVYKWNGYLPKKIPSDGTPENTGGIGSDLWEEVGDQTLRFNLSAVAGAVLVGLGKSNVLVETPFVSPEMKGALDVASELDTKALIDAFYSAMVLGVGVKLSRMYKCSDNIEISGFISDVFGLGQGSTGIVFDSGFGLVVDNSGVRGTRKAMRMVNTSLRTRGELNATALRFKGTSSAKYGEQLKLTDVLFANDETGAFGWDCCVELDNASQVFMDHCSMSGLSAMPTNCCIRLKNSSRNINFTNGCASDFTQFMDVTSSSEGVTVAFNHIIAGRRGIVSHDTGGNSICVIGNHFNTSLSAVELGEGSGIGSNHCKISDNFCIVFNHPLDVNAPYIGFDICSNYNQLTSNEVLLTGFTKPNVIHTRLRGNSSGTRYASGNTVANPLSNGVSQGVVVAVGATNNSIYGNQRSGMTLSNDLVDSGTNTRYWLLDSDTNAFLTGDIKLCRVGAAGVRQMRVHTSGDNNVADGVLRFIGGTPGVANDGVAEFTFRETVTKVIRPAIGNAYSCGASGAPWAGGFTQTAFTVTSDERAKTRPLKITDKMLDAASEVDWVQYQYLDRVEVKGEDKARWHFGAIAQRYVEAFTKHGLDPFEFAFICYDEWGYQPEITETHQAIIDEDGTVVCQEYVEIIQQEVLAGSRYGIRYEEALALEAALQRRNYQQLLKRIEALEAN